MKTSRRRVAFTAGGGLVLCGALAVAYWVGAGRAARVPLPDRAAAGGSPPLESVVLATRPATLAPGIHVVGDMHPSVVYVVETSQGLLLFDAGLEHDHDRLVHRIREFGLDPARIMAILLTHAHGDHTLGAAELRRQTGAKIYVGQADAAVVREGGPREAVFSMFEMPGVRLHPTPLDVELSGGETLTFGDTRVHVLATPGHTPGSLCYLVEHRGLRALVSGDTIMSLGSFGNYAVSLPPRYRGDAAAYLKSLRMLRDLPAPDLLLPAHPMYDVPPKSPYFTPAAWQSLLDRGVRELQTTCERLAADGADFLDGNRKEVLPGVYYLGDLRGAAQYLLSTPSAMLLVDAAGGDELVDWLARELDELGLAERSLTAVLLTSCAPEAVSGLSALVRSTGCSVVGSEAARATVERLCPGDTKLLDAEQFRETGWLDCRTLPLADVHPAAMAYVLKRDGKMVLISGRIPESSPSQLRVQTALAAGTLDVKDYERSLKQLLEVRPDVWLPAARLHGANANLYDDEWKTLVDDNLRLLREAFER